MEPLEAFSDAEWDCFGRMFANEEHDNSPEFHGQSSLLLGEDDGLNIGIQSTFCSTHEGHTNCYFSYPDHVLTNNAYTPMRFCMMDETNSGSFVPLLSDIVMGETVSLNEDGRSDSSENSDHGQMEHIVFPAKQLRLKRKLDVPELEVPVEDINSSENLKKKPCISKDVQGCVKNARSLPEIGTW